MPKSPAKRSTKIPTKTAILLKLLRRPKGATIAELQKVTGWQAHSLRAALTGLRKAGHDIVRETSKAGISRYQTDKDSAK